jgi:hypothetical protein
MFAFGISRFDAGAEGVHLAWSAPDVVCLSSPGFDIQRRLWLRDVDHSCATLDATAIAQLRTQHELQTLIGTILYRQSGPLVPINPTSAQSWPPGNTIQRAEADQQGAPPRAAGIAGARSAG